MLATTHGVYIHFSNSDRFGISYHHNVHPGNPRALYGFPITQAKLVQVMRLSRLGDYVEDWADYIESDYIYLFTINAPDKILDADTVDPEKVGKAMKKYVIDRFGSRISPDDQYAFRYFTTPEGMHLFRFVQNVVSFMQRMKVGTNAASLFNMLLRGAGYVAIETRKGAFGDGIRAEVAIVDPSVVTLRAKYENPWRKQ